MWNAEVKSSPCVAPIGARPISRDQGVIGEFGTSMGYKTDATAAVMDRKDTSIPNLFGADTSNVVGGCYPSGGINLWSSSQF
ncbi:FAD-binding protein [Rhizobium sp. P40RR-XXII]|uniref:FAD-binding protein n=1 Tax=Rhizobium sp. P40RR-XXII TaxID=2726739 RepID=UPI00145693A5|nr:FAD-binding protein [Rhizobium sp. P40RR-XXII]